MFAFLLKLLLIARSRLRSRASIEAENLVLRQQVIVLSRNSPSRVWLRNIDRLIFVWLYRCFPAILNAITVVKLSETVIRWHRRGFRVYWRWKSRRCGGRLRIGPTRDPRPYPTDERGELIVGSGCGSTQASCWMLGIEVPPNQPWRGIRRTRRQGPPSQGWKTFLRNQTAGIASIDLFVVRTISFRLLYGLVILRHARRRLVSISVTSSPTAEWIAGQVTDAFPWVEAPRHLIRDRDGAFGPAYARRIRAMGIRDHPIAPRSPWQNGQRRAAHRPRFRRGNLSTTSSYLTRSTCAVS